MKTSYFKQSVMLAVIAIALFALPACNKSSNKNYTVVFNPPPATITIYPTAVSPKDTFGAVTTPYNLDSFVKSKTSSGTSLSNITSVTLSSCVVTILSGGNNANNFGNFGNLTATFSSASNSAPYEIGVANNPLTYSTVLTMPEDTTTQLKSYFYNGTFNYSLIGVLHEYYPITDTLVCNVQFIFNMNIQG